MPRTVAEGFRDFLASLTPSGVESAAATGHRASIEACLKNNFVLNRLFRTGSTGNGTSISGYSDVDYFASLGTNDLSDTSIPTRLPHPSGTPSINAFRIPASGLIALR